MKNDFLDYCISIITGCVTANAGTNLNTSALALETTQSTINGKTPALRRQFILLPIEQQTQLNQS